MVPAAYAKSLPFNPNLDPFEIIFILDEQEYQQDYEWLNSLNNDSALILDLFKIRVLHKKKLFDSEPGQRILKALGRSNVIAQVLHQGKGFIHVEHQNIKLSDGDTERFRQSLNLFLLQLCRANIDEIREMKYFSQDPQNKVITIFDSESPIEKIEATFEKLSEILSARIQGWEIQRVRPFKFQKEEIKPYSTGPSNYNVGSGSFLSFQVAASFSDYTSPKDKKDILDDLDIIQDKDGNFVINSDDLRLLLLKGGFMIKRPEGGVDPWIEPEKIFLTVTDNTGKQKTDRYPILHFKFGKLSYALTLKSKEGTILYIGALLMKLNNRELKREDIINIFKNIPEKTYPPINPDNFEEYVSDDDLSAYEWLREIYKCLFGEESFNNWCYQLYKTDCDRPFRTGLNILKGHIKDSMEKAGLDLYTPFINIEPLRKDSSKNGSEKKDRLVYYTVGVLPSNISFIGNLSFLRPATEAYIKSKPKLSE